MTDVKLVKDCGLYPSYKKIIDFTGTKSEIIRKQLTWIDSFEHLDIPNVNYNKFQNKLTLPLDYEEALTYTYAVLENISGTDDKPMFFFINEVANLSNDLEVEPNIAISLNLDPIMTYMGDWKLDECMVDREHVDRWSNISVKPSRITPNIENAGGFKEVVNDTSFNNKLDNKDVYWICVAFTSDKLDVVTPGDPIDNLYYAVFPIVLSETGSNVHSLYVEFKSHIASVSDVHGYASALPTLKEVIDGTFLNEMEIAPNDIVSISILPVSAWEINSAPIDSTFHFESATDSFDFTLENASLWQGSTVYWIGTIPFIRESDGPSTPAPTTYKTTRVIKHGITIGPNYIPTMMQVFTGEDLIESTTTIDLEFDCPVKPTDGVEHSDIYEPALYMSPYRNRHITDGKGQSYLEIPDNQFYKYVEDGNLAVKLKQLMDGSNNSLLIFVDDPAKDGTIGSSTVIPNETLFVVNDAWKTYALTQKDSDRQMVVNYAIKNAIDNLIYMSYGGALVGSRSISEQPFYQKGMEGVHSYGWVDYNSGYKNPLSYPGHDVPGHLTKYGKRVVNAVGLAAGASIVTSLVDAHVAWANQLEKERAIKNQPAGLLQGGTGQSLLSDNLSNIHGIELKVDDITYQRSYENFRKYGYWVNKFEKPDIQSRKYFNYLLTNGAIVNGSINQGIRDVIASIFDAGVTIFHYDSEDAETRKLEYTEKENIEMSLVHPGSVFYTFPPLDDDHSITAVIEHE